jgi:hypothetical protein
MFHNLTPLKILILFVLALLASLGVFVVLKIFLALGIAFIIGLTTGAFFTTVYFLRKKKSGRFG